MRKIISILLCLGLLCGGSIESFAEETQDAGEMGSVNTEAVEEAATLLRVLDAEDFEEITAKPVTRAEFVFVLMRLLGSAQKSVGISSFSDVSKNAVYADAVYWAAEMGLVSTDTLFRPDDVITRSEAIKLVLSAMGFSRLAEGKGGYPTGYLLVASNQKLLKNFPDDDAVTWEGMAVLLYNMLNGEMFSFDSVQNDVVYYRYKGETLLYVLYGIASMEGIVTQTLLTSYDPNYIYEKGNTTVAVNGESYRSKAAMNELFGMNCVIYYDDISAEKTVLAAHPKNNRELLLHLKDVDGFDGGLLKYYTKNSDKARSIRVESAYTEVYNGKVIAPVREHITDSTGELRLVDNDRDGVYEVVYISHYTYVKVKSLNINNRVIEDANDATYNISIDEDKVFLSVADEENAPIKVSEIESGHVLEVLKSMDSTIVNIRVLMNQRFAKIDRCSSEEEEITIGETAYTVSDYAKLFCEDRFAPGTGVRFYVGHDNEIAYAEFNDSGYLYGYVTKLASQSGGLEPIYKLRVFTMAGIFEAFSFSNKVMFNGMRVSDAVAYDGFATNFSPQLVRYKLNAQREITALDTAEVLDVATAALTEWEEKREEDNSLTKYELPAVSSGYMFRSNYCFGTAFNAVGASIFCVPVLGSDTDTVDVQNEDEFEVVSVSSVRTGFAYDYFDVYDMDEYNCASVLVARKVPRTGTPYSIDSAMLLYDSYGMISDISWGVSSSGETGTMVELWTNGMFAEYFLPDDVECPMAPDGVLEPGDIVRYRIDASEGTEIVSLILDFDVSTFSGNRNYDTRSSAFNGGNSTLMYQVGKLYNYNSTFCKYSNTVEADGQYVFTPTTLLNSQINARYICRFDPDTKTVTRITLNDLRPYKLYGEDADYLVMKQSGLTTQAVYAYGKGAY